MVTDPPGSGEPNPRLLALYNERMIGMPRWHIGPGNVQQDPEDVTAARRAALEALAHERPTKSTYRHLRAA